MFKNMFLSECVYIHVQRSGFLQHKSVFWVVQMSTQGQLPPNQSQPVGAVPRNPQQQPKTAASCKVGKYYLCVCLCEGDDLWTQSEPSVHFSLFPLCASFLSISSFLPEIISDFGWGKSDDDAQIYSMLAAASSELLSVHLQVIIDDSDEEMPLMKTTRPPPRYVCVWSAFW